MTTTPRRRDKTQARLRTRGTGALRSKQRLEKSAGVIVFHPGDRLEYLLIFSTYWEFPKGQVESDESETEAAVREVMEETGLEVELLDGFRHEVSYFYRREGRLINKQVVYFIGQSKSRSFKLSWEHNDAKWLDFAAALRSLKYENSREVLTRANEYLGRKSKDVHASVQ